MDIRCGSCSKLFRVADEKIAGKGVRFKCSRCGEMVTVTKDEFELDKMARDEAAVESAVPPPAPPVPLAAGPGEATMPPQPDQDFQPREYQPPQTDAGSLGDFDFSEPHAAAAASADGGGAVMEGGFSFGDQSGLDDQEGSSEISISEEDAQAAEAAFQFPTDIIAEPKPLPSSKSRTPPTAAALLSVPAEQEDVSLDLGAALAMPAAPAETPKPAPGPAAAKSAPPSPPAQKTDDDDLDLGAALAMPRIEQAESPKPAAAAAKTGPVFTPPLKPAAKNEDDTDLGAALSMPRADSDEAEESEPSAHDEQPASGTADTDYDGEINPFSSGNITGAIAGIICTIPVVLLFTLGMDIAARIIPVLSAMPVLYLVAVAASGITGLGIMIGLLIAVVQAQTGKRFFFLVNILIGTFFGAVFGAGMSAVVALASGSGFSVERISAAAIAWGGVSFLLGIFVVIARRLMVFTKEETFGAEISTLGKVGLGLSALVILGALYGEGTLSGRMEQALKQMAKQAGAVQKKMTLITPDGLAVVNGMAYPDPASGDLVITGAVQNMQDRPKEGWYLEADVLDAGQKVLATVRVLNGVQLFSQRDRAVLAKRSVNIDALRESMVQASRSSIPARGTVPFEVRLYEMPAGSVSFMPNLKRFDPASFATKTAEPGK
ncbi:MAG: zinc-ribbon domain-containing protein [Nitrospirota bacterium]|nr:zinc-ribbon domain-containing protein [Nitrospirota bacterium]